MDSGDFCSSKNKKCGDARSAGVKTIDKFRVPCIIKNMLCACNIQVFLSEHSEGVLKVKVLNHTKFFGRIITMSHDEKHVCKAARFFAKWQFNVIM